MSQNWNRMFLLLLLTTLASGADEPQATPSPKVRYTSSKDVNFEQLLIQGQLKRPELTVVTGSTDQGADGLLRLRENFVDRMMTAAGEEPPQ